MWSQLLVPLLFISTVRGASPEFGPFTTEQMDQMRKNFKAAGECLHYCGGGTDLTLCEDFCGYELGFAAMGCQSLHDECKWTDDQGKNFAPGSCKCADDLEIATLIADIVFEGLSHLDEVICAVMFEAISLTVQIGLAAIPGPGVAISSGMRAGINAAKTIAENGMDAAQFTNWYSPVCGNGPIVEDISKTFDIWSAVPDEVVPGNGCVKKNKKCKNKGDDKGDDKKTDSPKTTKAATSTTAKATTTTTSSTFTTKYSDVPRPTLAFDACDLPDSDCYGSFDDFEGLEDNPLIYGEGSLEDGRLPTNPSPINQTDPSTNQTAPWTNLTRRFALEKRDRKYDVNLGGALGTLQIESLGYPGPQDLFEDGKGKKLTAHAYDFKSKNVDDYAVKDAYVKPGKAHTWAVEHVIELQTIKMFIEAAVGGSLSQTVPAQFFKDFWNKPLDGTLFNSRAKPQIEQANFKPAGKTLNNLVFQALGSSFNRAEFVLCEKSINSFKERVWSLSSPMDDSGFKTYVEDGAKGAIGNNIFLSGLRTTLAVYSYMSDGEISKRLKNAVANVKVELGNVPTLTGQNYDLGALWAEFMTAHLKKVNEHGTKWLTAKITLAEEALDKEIKSLNTAVDKLRADEKKLTPKEIDTKQAKEKQLRNELRKLDKDRDDADRAVEDQKAKIEGTSDKTKKKAEKALLPKRQKEAYAALKAHNLKERELNMLWANTAEKVVKNLKDDQAVLAKFKAAVKTASMPTV